MKAQKAGVGAAVELLQEETGKLVEMARRQGAEAYERGDMVTFARIHRQCQELEGFAQQVEALAKQWRGVGRGRTRRAPGRTSPRPPRGALTPVKDYVLPILRVLHDAGGSAPVDEVKAGLMRIMGPRLTAKDRGLLKGGEVRWVNRAQWVRLWMVRGGLLSASSKRGVWEITPEGEAVLRSGDVDAVWPKLLEAKSSRRT